MDERFHLCTPDPALLAAERDRVLALLRALLPGIPCLEIGSTAVPGVIGKGDIDLLVRAPAAQLEAVRACLDGVLARNPAQLSNAQYQGYRVDSPLDVAVQLTVAGGPYDDFLPFLEALRADPALVAAYNALKRAWDGRPMDDYRAAKSKFIEEVLRTQVG